MKQKLKNILLFAALIFLAASCGSNEPAGQLPAGSAPAYRSASQGLVPCGGPDQAPCTLKDVFVLVARVTNTLIALAGIYAIYVIIGSGFWLIVTMGKEEDITKHRNAISQAVVGFVMVMFAYMFINTAVNYILLSAEKKACRLNLSDPLNYLVIHSNPAEHAKCRQ